MGFIIALLYLLAYYIGCGILLYLFAVLKSWEYTKVWNFKIKDGYIGILPYPKSMLWWMDLLVNRGK